MLEWPLDTQDDESEAWDYGLKGEFQFRSSPARKAGPRSQACP
jgi:hypothetical protein